MSDPKAPGGPPPNLKDLKGLKDLTGLKELASLPEGVELADILAALGQARGYLDITPADALELYRLAYDHARGARARRPASRFMTSPAISVDPDLPAPDLARLLAERGISGAPVAQAGRVLGVVSVKDFLPRLGLPKEASPMALVSGLVSGSLCALADLKGLTARDLMTAEPLTIAPDTPVGEAARLMDQRRINRLPVVEGGKLVGIVTRDDLVRACQSSGQACAPPPEATATPPKAPQAVSRLEIGLSFLFSLLAMALVGLLQKHWAGPNSLILLIGSMAATSVLLFGAPKSPLAQPRNVLGGHVLSALIGVSLRLLIPGEPWLAGALAVALAVAAMHATRTLHPPGGATALIAVTGGPGIEGLGYLYALMPVAACSVVLLAAAWAMNNLAPGRRYPEA